MAELCQMAELEFARVESTPVTADPADVMTRAATEEDPDLIVVRFRSDHGTPTLSGDPEAVGDGAACTALAV